MKPSFSLLIVAGLLAGCALGPDYERPATPTAAAYPEAGKGGAVVRAEWWKSFGDAELDALVAKAFAANTDLRQAVARVEQASAVLGEVEGASMPQVDATVTSQQIKISEGGFNPNLALNGRIRTNQRAALSTAFELDFWGRLRRAEQTLAESTAALKVPAGELPQRLAAIQKEIKTLKKAKPAAAAGTSPDQLLAAAVTVGDTKIVVAEASGSDAGGMRQSIDLLRRQASPIAVLLAATDESKVTLVAGISRELEARVLSAGDWIKEPATIVGGKGGGRHDMAQAGGKLVDKLPTALDAARRAIEAMLQEGET